MVKDMKEIWVFAETHNNNIAPVFGELVSKAREMTKNNTVCKVCGAIIGSAAAEEAAAYGVDKLYVIKSEDLTAYDADLYGSALTALVREFDPDVFLFGAPVQ